MTTRLFIAEKPSLAEAIAANLPGTATKNRTYYEVGNDFVTWCIGHVLEQFMPEEYDENLKKWKLEDLPIVPKTWKLKVKEGMEQQVQTIERLLKKVDIVVNAGDKDREGQLLVDEVLHHFGNKKPVKRILVDDYNKVPESLADIRDNTEPLFQGWYQSALARSRFDWIFGLNLTRAYTIAAQNIGYQGVLTVGRVQTPTLGMIVQRDLTIENFKSIPFYTLTAIIQHENGKFSANWRSTEDQPGLDDSGRLIDQDIAQALATRLKGKPVKITEYEKKPVKENPPLLYSLSSLQMDANDRYGFSAQAVLNICQDLYEKHKLTTYPRTDSEYLSEVQHADASNIISVVTSNLPELNIFTDKADPTRKSPAFNDKKVTAHHAIVPTGKRMDTTVLKPEERQIYDMIVRVYLAQFFPPHQYMATTIETIIDGENFIAKGKTPISAGWREIYSQPESETESSENTDEDSGKQALPVMQKGDHAHCDQCEVNNRKTSPPARFTEKLLIAAMKNIHKYVTDPAAKARLKDGQGIGTEATRAGIIEELKKRGFIAHPKAGSKQLVSTQTGRALIMALPSAARNPALTGICEQALDLVLEGKMTADEFISKNMPMINKLVEQSTTVKINVPVVKCPKCTTGILRLREGKKGFFWSCSNWHADPKCDAVYDDSKGKPVFAPKKTAPGKKVKKR